MGRCYSGHILDMFEFEVANYQPMNTFSGSEVTSQLKPILVFQGESFDFSDKHRRLKNFLLDFFQQNEYEDANISEMKRVMSFTSVSEKKILFRQVEVNSGKPVNETDVANRTLSFKEIGPNFDLICRRDKIGTSDMFKSACKQPKISAEAKKLRKNVFTDDFGQKKGKVYLQQQELKTLNLRKTKATKKARAERAMSAKVEIDGEK